MDGLFKIPDMSSFGPYFVKGPDSPLPDVLHNAIASTAGEVVKKLQIVFDRFAATLADNEEIGIALASFGVQHTVHVESVTALGPNLILIAGQEDGNQVELVQHISQLNFLLIRVKPNASDGVPRRTIGFQAD